jgi:hypothetical protein
MKRHIKYYLVTLFLATLVCFSINQHASNPRLVIPDKPIDSTSYRIMEKTYPSITHKFPEIFNYVFWTHAQDNAHNYILVFINPNNNSLIQAYIDSNLKVIKVERPATE